MGTMPYMFREAGGAEMNNDKLISEAMRLLGSRKSKAKTAAARANGKKGGRPPKKRLNSAQTSP